MIYDEEYFSRILAERIFFSEYELFNYFQNSIFLMMECMCCKGKLERRTAPFQIHRKGYYLTFNEVPAWVCTQCGEVYFDEPEVETIQKVLQILDEQTEKLSAAV